MIDTIILTMPRGSYTILEPDKFQPSARALLDRKNSGSRSFFKCVQNPTAQDKKDGIYKPRLTLENRSTPRGWELPLRVEFSISKLIFGNNIDEVSEVDFPLIVETLKLRFVEMGVEVSTFWIERAPVSNMHFCKNFLLSDYVSASLIAKELEKINLNGQLDLNKTHFRNEGHATYYYASNNHLIFYDKMADTVVPIRRAVDKDKTISQLSLFKTYEQKKRIKDILRYEVRITNRQKLKSILADKNPIFKNVFTNKIAQKVLLDYWARFIDDNLYVFQLSGNDPINILIALIKNPSVKVTDVMATLGVKSFIDSYGMGALKQNIKHRFTSESWFRFNRKIEDIANNNFSTNFIVDEFGQMKQQLIDFKRFQFKDHFKA